MKKIKNKQPRREDLEGGDVRRMRSSKKPAPKVKYRHMSHWLQDDDDFEVRDALRRKSEEE